MNSTRARTALLLLAATIASTLALSSPLPTAIAAEQTGGGVFVPVSGFRLVDTASGVGGSDIPIGPGEVRTYRVTGLGGVPTSGVSAAVIDVAALGLSGSSSSLFTVWPKGGTKPQSSILRFSSTELPRSNTAIVQLSNSGEFNLQNDSGSTRFNIDVQGYFTTASTTESSGGYVPIRPERAVDTTSGRAVSGPLLAGVDYDVSVTDMAVPRGAVAVFANVKVFNAPADGSLRVSEGNTSSDAIPVINYQAESYNDSGLTIPLSAAGTIRVRNLASDSPVDVRIDIQGYFSSGTDGSSYQAFSDPPRFYNSKLTMQFESDETRMVSVAGIGGFDDETTPGAIVLTVMAQNFAGKGAIVIYNPDNARPPTSDVNFSRESDSDVGLMATSIVEPSAEGVIAVNNTSGATVDVILTAQGWFPASAAQYVQRQAILTATPVDQGTTWTGPDPELGNLYAGGGETSDDADLSFAARDSEPNAINYRAGVCAGDPRHKVVMTWEHAARIGRVQMRCGNYQNGQGWGAVKMYAKGRWDPWWFGMIGATVQNPTDTVHEGTSLTFKTGWFTNCSPQYRFVVVVELSNYFGHGRKGLITAYQKWRP